MAWTDYATAPQPGTRICEADRVNPVLSLRVGGDRGGFPLLVLRVGDGFRAYVNACPHQYLPLDHRGDRILSADGTMLMCTAHGARFDITTGQAVQGADCGLDPVPVLLSEGMLVIDDAP
ncbi:Rieske (2Fe-2S) protein [Paracoccus sp. PARArs4]|uniref:Rieske (2Fe-2S) protein n=1 Tax=Paracoccus sp. PARArs4 TaxID=2853442 RepID=UPI0024A794C7|nr:Rieske (2Fe-2S) protein [Paracoccus sp. PARArs4]